MFLFEFGSVYIIATDLYLEHTLEKQNENPHGWDVLSRGLKSVLRTYPKPILRTFQNLYLEHPSGEPMGTPHTHIYIYMCVCVCVRSASPSIIIYIHYIILYIFIYKLIG